jgi:hypothetical protein
MGAQSPLEIFCHWTAALMWMPGIKSGATANS